MPLIGHDLPLGHNVIVLRRLNDVFLTFTGDQSDIRNMYDWFSFDAPNAKYDPRFKAKYWDGKIHMVNLNDRTVPAGLIHDINQFAEMTNTDISVEGTSHNFPGLAKDIPPKIIDGFMDVLAPKDNEGEALTYDSWQRDAIHHAITYERGILISPTASGKSLIAYSLIRWYREIQDRRILVIVPTTSLVSQLCKNFQEYSADTFTDYCDSISGGHKKNTNARVLVATWQSIVRMPPDWFEQFGAVLVDEVHTAEAKCLQSIMRRLTECPFRIGLTGTLRGTKTHEMALKGMFGPVRQVTTTREMIDAGRASEVEIVLVKLSYSKDECISLKKAIKLAKETEENPYQPEVDLIINHPKRNEVICNIALKAKGCTLVLFKNLEHGKRLYEDIKNSTDRPVYYVSGQTDVEEREAVRGAAEADDVIIVASLGVFSTGINIKKLHNLIFAHPTKSKIKVLQSIGRVLRVSPDGRIARVFDIVDDLRDGNFVNYAWAHSAERLEHYIREDFRYRSISIKL